jgi:methylated-DNA-[protein]-cysteine S-methyltransferase
VRWVDLYYLHDGSPFLIAGTFGRNTLMKLFFQNTAIGRIGIAEESGRITNLYFGSDVVPHSGETGETEGIKEAFLQLTAYLTGDLKRFDVPLAPGGTGFMRTVWTALCEVPYGTTASYKDIAIAVGNPKAVRAVGMANNRNPLPLFVPCHRIIGFDGKLVGYRGGLDLKRTLLELEKRHS